MHKSPFKFGLFLIASMMLSASIVAAIPMGSLNIFSNATAQGYNENYYEDKKYSKYPTNDYKYECQKGPFEGFFVSSVEFCDAKSSIDKDKKPIVLLEKKLFVCEDAQNQPNPSDISFSCLLFNPFFGSFPAPPNSREPDKTPTYISCTPELCRGIDESDFGAQIFKDVVTIPALSPQGTPVNLDKFHYTVTETDISNRLGEASDPFGGSSTCSPTGFDSRTSHLKITEDLVISYDICTQYVGDCEGTIYPGEVKTCTIKNYIWSGSVLEGTPPIDASSTTKTGTTTTSQSNNAITSQTNNVITNPTTTQSSEVGKASLSSNTGAAGLNTFPPLQ